MSRRFGEIAFTPLVKKEQEQHGSRRQYARMEEIGEPGDRLTDFEREFIAGREFTIGVFRSKGEIITLPFTEVKSKKEFFDFEAKYTAGLNEETTPAIVDEAIAAKVRATAKKIYTVFNCRGIIRIDFIYNEEKKELFMLEINTVPGQSEASIVPQQLKVFGWSLKEFYSTLIDEALGVR